MINPHLLVLQVVIPLLGAPLCVLLHRHLWVWWIALSITWANLIMAGFLLAQVQTEGEITYAIGGWAAPWGIEYRLDMLNAFVLLIISGIAAITMTSARESVLKEIAEDRIYLFYTAFLLHLAGLSGVIVTGDVFNVFVFIEIASLSSYAMISASRQKQSLWAAYRYLILGTVGATFILISVGLIYAMTGTLNMADIAVRIRQVDDTRTIATALAFFTVGVSIKFGLFPLHYWLPNAYTYAPSMVSAFLAGTTSKVFIYVLLRFLFTIFGTAYVFDTMLLDRILITASILAIFSGSLAAIYQNNIKKLLAYSSIAQIGYIVLGLSLVSVTGLMAGILHLFNHALMKTALFMVVACFMLRVDSMSLKSLQGIGRQMPLTALAFVIGGFSLIGVPLTVGFISKWYLVLAALKLGWWWLIAIILGGSLLALVYVWKVIETLFFAGNDTQSLTLKEAPLSLLLPVWIIVLANIYFGVDTTLTVGVAHKAAALLLEQ